MRKPALRKALELLDAWALDTFTKPHPVDGCGNRVCRAAEILRAALRAVQVEHVDDRRERCKWCGRISGLAWTVPDEVWVRVMGETHKTACIDCFDAFAVQNGVDYVGTLTLHGYVSLATELRGHAILNN